MTTLHAVRLTSPPSLPNPPPSPEFTSPEPTSPRRLSPDQVAELGRRLDDIRRSVLDTRGTSDAEYIRRVIRVRRGLELASRLVLVAGRNRPAWILGTTGLGLAKILDNMEIGHNVLHGQWDWMRDPRIHSTTWEWDHATPPDLWQRSHNQTHHTFTNILGQDNDLGYGILRVDDAQPWERRHLAQPFLNLLNALAFEYGIAAYDLDLGRLKRGETEQTPQLRSDVRRTLRRVRRQAAKEYVVWPLLSGRGFARTATANVVANMIRNVWSHSGDHVRALPRGRRDVRAGVGASRRVPWRVVPAADARLGRHHRPRWLHVLSGNLSHQIEHHLFPDLPSNRYGEIAPQVRRVFEDFGLRYHAAPLHRQVLSAWHKVVRLSLPNGWLAETTLRTAPRRIWRLLTQEASSSPSSLPQGG